MEAKEYFGTIFSVDWSTDLKVWKTVGACYDLSSSIDTDDVSRTFTDGSALNLKKGYKHTAEFKVTKVTAENLGIIVPGNVYKKGDAIDGVAKVKAGNDGAVQVGEPIKGKATPLGHLRLTPSNSAQKPIYMLNATASISGRNMDDGIGDVTLTVTFDKDIQGDIVVDNA